MTDWSAEPKLELHLHLEGAAPVALTRRLAEARGEDFSRYFDGARYRWDDFSGFLLAYDRVDALYDTPESQAELAEAVLRECAAHGVIYAEIILSPDHAGGAMAAWSEHLAAVTEGVARAERDTGAVARFLAVGVRQNGPERVENSARLAAECGHPRLVGFNLAGDERVHRPRDFARAFAIAREAGLGLTAHAGEFGGADSVRAALDELRVSRIGHGVRAVEDPALLRRIVAEGVTLEVCPGSNIALGVYPDMDAHPLKALVEAGARVTLSTDDPPFFGADMTREYAQAARALGWGPRQMRRFAQAALDAAFCGDETKAELAARLEAA